VREEAVMALTIAQATTLIQRVMAEPNLSKITFQCGTRYVDKSLFVSVSNMVARGRIKVLSFPVAFSPDLRAGYDSAHDLFGLRDDIGMDLASRSIIVHESVHAGFDIIGHGQNYSRADNEPAAFIAEALYLLATDRSVYDRRRRDNSNSALQNLAFDIALNKMQHSKQKSYVEVDELLQLRTAAFSYSKQRRFNAKVQSFPMSDLYMKDKSADGMNYWH
jgi:hypothetical protein